MVYEPVFGARVAQGQRDRCGVECSVDTCTFKGIESHERKIVRRR